jgi:hypothetical protein
MTHQVYICEFQIYSFILSPPPHSHESHTFVKWVNSLWGACLLTLGKQQSIERVNILVFNF